MEKKKVSIEARDEELCLSVWVWSWLTDTVAANNLTSRQLLINDLANKGEIMENANAMP